MRVILLQDIENLGKKYDIKEVKDGYARNFLIPKKLVIPVTEENLKWLETQKEMEVKRMEEELREIQKVISKIDGTEIVIPVKVGKNGKIFGSITERKIAQELKGAGFEIKKTQIELLEPIKELGEFPIKIHFKHNLEAEIKVIVIEEGS